MIGVFELFKIGIGPSSSHTVGPMKAAFAFVDALAGAGLLPDVARVEVALYGSLAWTGKGHGTDKAAILGLAGELHETIDPDNADAIVQQVRDERRLVLAGRHPVRFDAGLDILFDGIADTPKHPNTLAFRAFDRAGAPLAEERWCSIGGGSIVPRRTGQPVLPARCLVPECHGLGDG